MAHHDLMLLRPTSQMLRNSVVPEVRARVNAGSIKPAALPVEVNQFRILQGGGKSVVQLNDEVDLVIETTAKRPILPGEPITLADIDPHQCSLKRPTLDGSEAAYFLFQSQFLNPVIFFDFIPNSPQPMQGHIGGLPYPVAEVIAMRQLLGAIKPVEQFGALAAAGWPPAPGYYPAVLAETHARPQQLGDQSFVRAVAEAYGAESLRRKVELWREVDLFPGRIPYVEKAIGEYLEGDFVSSIYVIAPQFEGIVGDYLRTSQGRAPDGFKDRIQELRSLVLSRVVLVFPRPVLESVLAFVETGSFWANSRTVVDPRRELNRHGLLHGEFTGFEGEELALRYLVLLDGLAYVLLHDKMLAGAL